MQALRLAAIAQLLLRAFVLCAQAQVEAVWMRRHEQIQIGRRTRTRTWTRTKR